MILAEDVDASGNTTNFYEELDIDDDKENERFSKNDRKVFNRVSKNGEKIRRNNRNSTYVEHYY